MPLLSGFNAKQKKLVENLEISFRDVQRKHQLPVGSSYPRSPVDTGGKRRGFPLAPVRHPRVLELCPVRWSGSTN